MIQQPWLFSPLKNYSVGIQGLQIRLATHVQNWAGRYEPLLNRQGLNVYNFYSSGDEVFDESPEAPGVLTGVFHWPTTDFDWPYFHLNLKLDAFAWQKREVLKGVNAVGSLSAGWGFYCGDIDTHNESRWGKYTAAEANEMVNNGSIVTNTVFDRSVPAMFQPIISDFDKADILASYIPAVSSPAGKIVTIGEKLQDELDFDLNENEYRSNGWGRKGKIVVDSNGLQSTETPWLHSDIKNMAYYYVYPAFTNIVEKGEMK